VQVAVVGNLSLDLVDGRPPRPGGPPYYAAKTLAKISAPAIVRAKCAESDRARLVPALEAFGVAVEWRSGERTATYAFSYEGDARAMEVRELGSTWTADEVGGLDAEWVHVGALFQGEFPPQTLAALTESGARLSFDGQGLVRPARIGPLELEPDAPPDVLRHLSVLKLSEDEARVLAGRLEERSLSALGVPEVVVTLGSRGCVVVARRQLFHIPTEALDVDPTGAGDAFAAAYIVERSRGQSPRQAADRATRLVRRVLSPSR
jgi:sugar/nucleoside kinase (ribokinase family)